jgi:hypothetical protein
MTGMYLWSVSARRLMGTRAKRGMFFGAALSRTAEAVHEAEWV